MGGSGGSTSGRRASGSTWTNLGRHIAGPPRRETSLSCSRTMTTRSLYQLEVKLGLAKLAFQASAGWRLTMHIDPMEKGLGGTHARGKLRRANAALRELRRLGVTIGTHKMFRPVDVVADHPSEPTRLIEVEGRIRKTTRTSGVLLPRPVAPVHEDLERERRLRDRRAGHAGMVAATAEDTSRAYQTAPVLAIFGWGELVHEHRAWQRHPKLGTRVTCTRQPSSK